MSGAESLATTELVTAMLRHFDWSPASKALGRYEVWTLAENDAAEVVIPLDPQKGDFNDLVERALRQLLGRYGSEAERVRELLLLTASADLDSTQWKKQTPVDAGLISWTEGEGIFQAARDSLASAARAVHAKKAHHGNAGSYLVQRFLEQTLMGQTEVGSFIVTAHIPASARFHVSQKSENRAKDDWRHADQVSGRTILDTFATAISAVRTALDEYKSSPRLDPFKELVADGVSHELVRSLATLARGGDAAISITHGELGSAVQEITFDSVESPVLDRVAADFAQAPPPQDVRVVGEVSLLDNSTAVPIHLVRLDVMSGASVKRARVRLNPEQYELAVAAHADHKWLSAAGRLEKDGRDWWLYNAADVAVVDIAHGPATLATTLFGEQLDTASEADSPE